MFQKYIFLHRYIRLFAIFPYMLINLEKNILNEVYEKNGYKKHVKFRCIMIF